MDPETKKLLEHTAAMVDENNILLRKMNRRAKWESFMHIIYWILIIAVTLGSYYFVEPYFQKIVSTYQAVQAGANKVNNFNPIDSLKNAFGGGSN